MPEVITFREGDRVIHPRRPEWGDGVVESVTPIDHDGRPAQRVNVKFANQGSVIINTGVAPLLRKEALAAVGSHASSSAKSAGGWIGSLESKPQADALVRLPDAMTDPFLAINKRLLATLDSYRYASDPRNPRLLFDWAIAQTGLNDPLSKYTRHELEQAFPRYARDRDNHLYELIRAIKRQNNPQILQEALQATNHNAGKEALKKALQR